ncbi:MAG: (2Fe-2S)-binding protein [Gammaproteobacteria bacterium]|nr:(2Fe-2S)-binding protein [Gammaproteobacteria bacterium]
MVYELNVNGNGQSVDVSPDTPLLWVLRDHIGLTGTKYGCGGGYCGACTVHVDGSAVRSCQLPVADLDGKSISTIESLEARHPELVGTWVADNVAQCGYCQAGQLMSAAALLDANPAPTDQDIDAAMTGNICRCGTYSRIRAAIHDAASQRNAGGASE